MAATWMSLDKEISSMVLIETNLGFMCEVIVLVLALIKFEFLLKGLLNITLLQPVKPVASQCLFIFGGYSQNRGQR